MERTLFTRKDLMERWGVSYQTLCNYEANGTLTRNPYFDNPMYYLEEIIKIDSLKEPNPLSPLERRRLDKKIEDLEKELAFYKETFNAIKMLIP